MVKLTPTEQRIYNLLEDGGSHSKSELQQCLYDELSEGSLYKHITMLRRKLEPLGRNIVLEQPSRSKTFYRLARAIDYS